ncbi:limb region 1 homolog-like protein [Salmo trutta]|uniref:Limb development membrane protein 1 like n=1 Tax=Salmo trutta TaxID=8032 RepID=A0A673Z1M7_SALTR|nr:limb region 1 homolog-like protein [Salmo trutta]
MEAPEDVSVREQLFHDRVRETIICVLLFICLYIVSYLVITHYKRNAEFTIDNSEDATVNKIALWLCTFTLSVSVGAVLLLPLSILSNEVLLSFPQSYYMQWLNGSLIHGLWNIVFLFSNLSLVFLLPFAYFFTESEGFAGSKKGVMARLYETAVVLFLLTLLVLGMVWVASAILDDNMARQSLYDLWEYYLPYLYSCISLFGVLLLLLCTPLGLSRMFSVTGRLLVKPRLLEDLDETMSCAEFEEASLSRNLTSGTSLWNNVNAEVLRNRFLNIQARRIALEIRKRASPWQRNLGYPLAMLLLLAVTVVCVLIVCYHVVELLFDDTAMPRGMEDPLLGAASFSMFGSLGAAVQVILILYLMISSVVGFYSSPLFTGLRPRAQDTTLTQIIGNCVSLLVLSSALPVFSRTLGITRFDLLGDFGRFNWLGNFHIVFLYNILFAGLTSACLINTLTWTVQRELIRAFGLHKLPSTVSRSTIPLRLLLANGLSKIQ